MKPSTIIRDWWIIDFERDGVDQNTKMAWGIVEEDPSHRWQPGDFCCSTRIKEEVMEEGVLYAITGNSVYQLNGQGDRITMPAKTILALRAGYAPPEIMASKSMREGTESS